jgi:hypothetical protein
MSRLRGADPRRAIFNAAIGWLVVTAWAVTHADPRGAGRRSGRTPHDAGRPAGARVLHSPPRGRTQWVRNVAASDAIVLRRGRRRERYALRALSEAEKPPVLKAYLDNFRSEVGRFFPVPAGSPVEAFAPLAPRYPAFALTHLPDA